MTNSIGRPLQFAIMAVQCSTCGLVVGTHEGVHIGNMLQSISDKLGIPRT